MKSGVAVEKLQFPPKQPKFEGWKMSQKSGTSFVGQVEFSKVEFEEAREAIRQHRKAASQKSRLKSKRGKMKFA